MIKRRIFEIGHKKSDFDEYLFDLLIDCIGEENIISISEFAEYDDIKRENFRYIAIYYRSKY